MRPRRLFGLDLGQRKFEGAMQAGKCAANIRIAADACGVCAARDASTSIQ